MHFEAIVVDNNKKMAGNTLKSAHMQYAKKKKKIKEKSGVSSSFWLNLDSAEQW